MTVAGDWGDDGRGCDVKYLIPLFSPSSNLIVTCPSNKSKEIKRGGLMCDWCWKISCVKCLRLVMVVKKKNKESML